MLKPRRIAVTGGTGFIGRAVCEELRNNGHHVRLLLRQPAEQAAASDSLVIGDLRSPRNIREALQDIDVVVHAAAAVHAMSGRPDIDYRQINTDATLHLADAARQAGVRRFIFMSSIRAQCGPWSHDVLTEKSPPAPQDAYGLSKWQAEQGLAAIGIDWAALRPVIVYGPGAVGNIRDLLRIAKSPWPLPFGSLCAKRSLASVNSVARAVRFAAEKQDELRRPLIVAEPDALTIAEIIAALRAGMGRRSGIFPVPEFLLTSAATITGQIERLNRLRYDLVADASELTALGWQPAHSARTGLAALGSFYRDMNSI